MELKRRLLDLQTFLQGGLSEDLKSWIKKDVNTRYRYDSINEGLPSGADLENNTYLREPVKDPRSMLLSSHGDFDTDQIRNSNEHIE